MSSQTIFRNASANKPYSQILNTCLQDDRLSPEAGWTLVLLLSLPHDWKAHVEWICKKRNIGRDRARAAIRELERLGYCKRSRLRKSDGTLGSYEFLFTDQAGTFAKPAPEIQGVVYEQPAPEKPALVNPPPTKNIDHKEKQKKGRRLQLEAPGANTAPVLPVASDALIPFDNVIDGGRAVALDAKRRALAQQLGLPENLPFTTETLRIVTSLGVDPVPLVQRLMDRTKAKGPVNNPNAYLVRMAKGEAAKRNGITVDQLAAVSERDHAKRAKALAAQVNEPRPYTGAATPNGGALLAALSSRGNA